MSASRPEPSLRLRPAGILVVVATLVSCAGRAPRLVPPPGGVEAVEGYGSASIAGAEASVKGKFGFVFRKSGLGRVEAVDPIGRTAFVILFREDRAYFVLPSKKVYAEDVAGVMMERFLGVGLSPREAFLLLSGTWGQGATPPELKPGDEALPADDVWELIEDAQGRVVGGWREAFSFAVKSFFPGGAVPREIGLKGPDTSGRVKVLKLGFNPPLREGAFDLPFLRSHALRTWAEIVELIER